MSTASSQQTADVSEGPGDGRRRPRRSRRRAIAVGSGAVVVLAAVAGIWTADAEGAFSNSNHNGTGLSSNQGPTSLATVTQGTLSSQTQVNGTLDYAGAYTVLNKAVGTFTSLPSTGQTIRRGQDLYKVSNSPIVMLVGSVPAYRTLSAGMSGPDIRQLNSNLVALGYATRSELNPNSNYFSSDTEAALKKLQTHMGGTKSGTLSPSQVIFLPAKEIRVTKVSTSLGSPAGPGSPILQASTTQQAVTVALDTSEQSYVKVGDSVTVTLPNNSSTPGVVTSVGSVATQGSSGNATINVDIKLTRPGAAGNLDQAPVQVSITTGTVSNALIVPVDALLALGNNGYAVEIDGSGGIRRLVPVHLGLFDDAAGTVQVTGPGLAAGQRVVVPAL